MNTLRLEPDFYHFFCSIPRELELLSTVSSMREEIYEQEVNLDKLSKLSFSCSRYPSQGTQAMLTQDKETKKV